MNLYDEDRERYLVLDFLEGTPEIRGQVIRDIRSEHFYTDAAGAVFDRAMTLLRAGKTIPRVRDMGCDMALPEAARLMLQGVTRDEVEDSRCADHGDVELAIDQLETYRRARILYRFTEDIQKRMGAEQQAGVQVLDRHVEQTLDDLSQLQRTVQSADGDDSRVFGDMTDEELEEMCDPANQGRNLVTIGLGEVDRRHGGVPNGSIVVVSAPPGGCKTSMLLNMAIRKHILHKGDILFVELEMTEDQLFKRMQSILSGIPLEIINQGKYSREQALTLKRAMKTFRDFGREHNIRFEIQVPKRTTEYDMTRLAFKMRFGDYDSVYLDYLTLVKKSAGIKDLWEHVKMMAEELKSLAKETDSVIITGSQLNKEKGTKFGSAVQDSADLWLRWDVTEEAKVAGEFPIEVPKNRHGGRTPFTCYIDAITQQLQTEGPIRVGGVIDVLYPPDRPLCKQVAIETRKLYDKIRPKSDVNPDSKGQRKEAADAVDKARKRKEKTTATGRRKRVQNDKDRAKGKRKKGSERLRVRDVMFVSAEAKSVDGVQTPVHTVCAWEDAIDPTTGEVREPTSPVEPPAPPTEPEPHPPQRRRRQATDEPTRRRRRPAPENSPPARATRRRRRPAAKASPTSGPTRRTRRRRITAGPDPTAPQSATATLALLENGGIP